VWGLPAGEVLRERSGHWRQHKGVCKELTGRRGLRPSQEIEVGGACMHRLLLRDVWAGIYSSVRLMEFLVANHTTSSNTG
jgi:hypothetical protein